MMIWGFASGLKFECLIPPWGVAEEKWPEGAETETSTSRIHGVPLQPYKGCKFCIPYKIWGMDQIACIKVQPLRVRWGIALKEEFCKRQQFHFIFTSRWRDRGWLAKAPVLLPTTRAETWFCLSLVLRDILCTQSGSPGMLWDIKPGCFLLLTYFSGIHSHLDQGCECKEALSNSNVTSPILLSPSWGKQREVPERK